MRFRPTTILGVAGLAVVTVSGHETWMLPSVFSAKVGQEVRLDVTSGMSFPEMGSPIRLDRVAKAAYRLGGRQAEVVAAAAREKSLVLTQGFPEAGIATIWLELRPKEIELTGEQVLEYFEEIGASEELRRLWSNQKGQVPWNETYTKHVKTIVAIGNAGEDRSWQSAVGMSYEIVPVTNPLSLKVGDSLKVRMLLDGKPFPNSSVGLMTRGSKERVFRTTDAAGEASLPVSRAGEALIFSVYLRHGRDAARWESDFTTLTVPVRNAP